MAKTSKLDINNKKETLADMAQRYKVLSQPQVVNMVMRKFTYLVDKELKFRLETLPKHPKDTGLLQKSWQIPEKYLLQHSGKSWQVYLNNTATVGQQAILKAIQSGTVHRKKKRVGRHNLKRYLPFVDKRTKFYTKQLRVIRNKVDSMFKEFIEEVLVEAARAGKLSASELAIARTEFEIR